MIGAHLHVRRTSWSVEDIADQRGRTALVTGAGRSSDLTATDRTRGAL
jgi:hypothetical protein